MVPHVYAEKEWSGHLRRNYGIDSAVYAIQLAAQGGVCAICKSPPVEGMRLGVDHDHDTGALRGLLCNSCNRGIGQLKDDAWRVRRAASYLEGTLREEWNYGL